MGPGADRPRGPALRPVRAVPRRGRPDRDDGRVAPEHRRQEPAPRRRPAHAHRLGDLRADHRGARVGQGGARPRRRLLAVRCIRRRRRPCSRATPGSPVGCPSPRAPTWLSEWFIACSSFAAYNVDLALTESAAGASEAGAGADGRTAQILDQAAAGAGQHRRPLGRPGRASSPTWWLPAQPREPHHHSTYEETGLHGIREPEPSDRGGQGVERLTDTTRTGSAKPLSRRRPAGSTVKPASSSGRCHHGDTDIGQHLAGDRGVDEPGGQVHDGAVVVAVAGDDGAVRHPASGPGVADVERLDQRERDVAGRTGSPTVNMVAPMCLTTRPPRVVRRRTPGCGRCA